MLCFGGEIQNPKRTARSDSGFAFANKAQPAMFMSNSIWKSVRWIHGKKTIFYCQIYFLNHLIYYSIKLIFGNTNLTQIFIFFFPYGTCKNAYLVQMSFYANVHALLLYFQSDSTLFSLFSAIGEERQYTKVDSKCVPFKTSAKKTLKVEKKERVHLSGNEGDVEEDKVICRRISKRTQRQHRPPNKEKSEQ